MIPETVTLPTDLVEIVAALLVFTFAALVWRERSRARLSKNLWRSRFEQVTVEENIADQERVFAGGGGGLTAGTEWLCPPVQKRTRDDCQ